MKILCYSICLISCLVIFQACNKTDIYAQKAKSLDSLGGAVNNMLNELEKIDTIPLQKAITRFNYYDLFIQQNLNDTVDKSNADNLIKFYESGKSLELFLKNRKIIMLRAKVIIAQLSKLGEDVKASSIDETQMQKYISKEQGEADKLIDAGRGQQKFFYTSMEEFKNSLQGVERFIKSRNHGELPVIIKDTVDS